MKNDTYYFPHDFFARKDPKCIALIKDFGMSGYGVYWSLVEMMYEQGGKIKKFPSLFSAIAHEFNVKEASITKQIEAMLHNYELLLQDENYLWSDSVLRRMEFREAKKLKKSESGKLGGIKSGESRRKKKSTKQNEAMLQSNEANEAKERKGKENKGKEIKERVNGAHAPTLKSFKAWTEKEFIDDLSNFRETYPKDLLNEFFKYWSEKSATGRMKFQLEDTWETKKRLETWERNEVKFSK